ncbi:SpoIIE family protein phosphatase [Streptomyces sp. SL54]|uniref:SpoIIE family protein phosphatase n=1 Tax=Streptantibioticus silvisoli TaxID=2705255 RepID=A0ABT6W7X0_9ACTN|nr:SpoIIE family protein phosphatase [Streptantibioticus silvisoli]
MGGFLTRTHHEPDRPDSGDGRPEQAVAGRAEGHLLVPLASALLDDRGRILHWSKDSSLLLGYTPEEAVGSYASHLLAPEGRRSDALELFEQISSGRGWNGAFPVRHRDGHTVELDFRAYPVHAPDGRRFVLAIASEVQALRQVEADFAALDGFFQQSPVGLAVYDTELRFVRINNALARMNGLEPEEQIGRRLSEVLPGINTAEIEDVMRGVLETGEPVMDARSHGRTPGDPEQDRAWSASYFRLEAASGEVLGVSSSIIDVTERYQAEEQAAKAQQRLSLLAEAGAMVGTTLDLRDTARELVSALVPRVADVCGVHFLERLVSGLEPAPVVAGEPVLVRRLAVASAQEGISIEDLPTEAVYRVAPDSAYVRAMASGRTITIDSCDLPPSASDPDADRERAKLDHGAGVLRVAPLVARSTVLGVVIYARDASREDFDELDITLADELVARAAVALDNARLYLREHATLVSRQEALSEANAAREQLALINEAGTRIGSTLDLRQTAQELIEVVIPRFADFVTVDLLDSVLRGDEPYLPRDDQPIVLRAVAVGEENGHGLTTAADTVGEVSRFDAAKVYAQALRTGRSVLVPEVDEESLGRIVTSSDRVDPGLEAGIHSYLMVPVLARGSVLGGAEFIRTRNPESFTASDVALAEELVARAAISIDNARLYRRERETALTLQRSLLPQEVHHTLGLEIAYRYLPSSVASEVGGDWFDVVPLSCGRVALVVGDVMGHGMRAAATMGQLRTVARTLATLEMQPDQVLTRLDETASAIGDGQFATCVCAVYDPVDRSCVIACAGHLPPVVVDPGGVARTIELPPGVPLGVGGVDFESVEITIPEGSLLALYTDGLVERRGQDIDEGLRLLCETLSGHDRTPEQNCEAVISTLVTEGAEDDIAIIMAEVRPVPEGLIATLPLTDDITLASEARRFTRATLGTWGLAPLCEVTELLVSELVTNALRHAGPPRQLRLFRDRTLTVEVADADHQVPLLRPIDEDVESGRGMRLVNELAHRWGSRATRHGKVVWFELELPLGMA